MISKYSEFILENLINESMLYITDELSNILKEIDTDISNDILKSVGTDIKPDITVVDIDQDDYLSFSTMRSLKKNLTELYPAEQNKELIDRIDKEFQVRIANQISIDRNIISKGRNKVKLGRFINQTFPGKYTPKQVEEFINKYKAYTSPTERIKLELVSGTDIEFWYDKKNYLQDKGSLGGSCMANKSGIFELYTESENVRLLILKDVPSNKILGRALIWKLESIKVREGVHDKLIEVSEESFFMDRQYTSEDSNVEVFRNYAKENNWYYKTKNSHSELYGISLGDTKYTYSEMIVNVDDGLDTFPYLDTFRLYNPEDGELRNIDIDNEDKNEYSGWYVLASTGGGYDEIETGIYSEYEDRMIDEEDAVWSDAEQSSLHIERAVQINDDWYPNDSDDICYSDIDDETYLRNECAYSEYHDSYIHEDKYIYAISSIDIDDDLRITHNCDYSYADSGELVDLDNSEKIGEKTANLIEGKIGENVIFSNMLVEINIPDSEVEYAVDNFYLYLYKTIITEFDEDKVVYLPRPIIDKMGLKIDEEGDGYIQDIFIFFSNLEMQDIMYQINFNEEDYDLSKYSTDNKGLDVMFAIYKEYYEGKEEEETN